MDSGSIGQAPLVGVLAGIAVFSFLARRIEVAEVSHFESDRRRLFRTVTSEEMRQSQIKY